MLCSIALLVTLGASIGFPSASATLGNSHFKKRDALQPRQTNSTTAPAYSTEYWFDQLIDHANPSAGTFKQRYFFSDEYYKGQGSPIVIGTPGEQSADGFYTDLTGYSMMHAMLQVWGAAGVVLERKPFFRVFAAAEADPAYATRVLRSLLGEILTLRYFNRSQSSIPYRQSGY